MSTKETIDVGEASMDGDKFAILDSKTKYGELVVLGYNGYSSTHSGKEQPAGRSRSLVTVSDQKYKFELFKRPQPNGIIKSRHFTIEGSKSARASQLNPSNHSVTYTLSRNQAVVVEYVSDEKTDMFQVGRSSEPQIDFTVVDTWLGQQQPAPNHVGAPAAAGAQHQQNYHNQNKAPQSTISRYACRILIERDSPEPDVRVYAAGFDVSKNIFLGEKATKWRKKNDEIDGLTTNGVLILHPTSMNADVDGHPHLFLWREVSVDGDIYTLRETRSSVKRGDRVDSATNCLQDGTLIDLCGATLLWRSDFGLKTSPSRHELERRLDELNAGRPQCPVSLNTLIIPKRKDALCRERQPYVYLNCGHVQGSHDWGHAKDKQKHKCPICHIETGDILQLCMGVEPAFHLDSDALDYAFNPCGHVASAKTVKYWSRIPLPHGTNSFHPVCPFCTTILSVAKPFVKLIFQDHCF